MWRICVLARIANIVKHLRTKTTYTVCVFDQWHGKTRFSFWLSEPPIYFVLLLVNNNLNIRFPYIKLPNTNFKIAKYHSVGFKRFRFSTFHFSRKQIIRKKSSFHHKKIANDQMSKFDIKSTEVVSSAFHRALDSSFSD